MSHCPFFLPLVPVGRATLASRAVPDPARRRLRRAGPRAGLCSRLSSMLARDSLSWGRYHTRATPTFRSCPAHRPHQVAQGLGCSFPPSGPASHPTQGPKEQTPCLPPCSF